MRPGDLLSAQNIDASLLSFSQNIRKLPGIDSPRSRNALIEQILESIRRVKYIAVMRGKDLSDLRLDPSSNLFDPLKAAILQNRQGNIDEAFWLVFLSVHFGKHRDDGWRLVRDIYGQLSGQVHWSWARTSADPASFRAWLAANEVNLKSDGVLRRFGNHRKYETLRTTARRGTATVFESYVRWVGPNRGHSMLIKEIEKETGADPYTMFDCLYHSMSSVMSFGRTARFDYLTMIGKLGLAPIEPGSPYLKDATGPLSGARLLFSGSDTASIGHSALDSQVIELGRRLDVGMQVMEDALCNWQKNPNVFIRFRG